MTLTSLKDLTAGSEVNLEKALLPTTRLGGHLVSGHVDGLVTRLKHLQHGVRRQARRLQAGIYLVQAALRDAPADQFFVTV